MGEVSGDVSTNVSYTDIKIELRKLNMELPYDSAILLLGLYPKKPETLIGKIIKIIGTRMFTAASFTITKTWKQPQCPALGERVTQLWSICTVEYDSAVTKKEVLPCATARMDPEEIIGSGISQPEKDQYCMISLICGL